MKVKDLIYKTPELSEDKLLELVDNYKHFLKKDLIKKLEEKYSIDISKAIMKEWNVIQEKKSDFSREQRNQILGIVAMCLIKMTKGDE